MRNISLVLNGILVIAVGILFYWHFNDSKAPFNSRVDRHWHIGEGHIGADALRRFAQHPKLAHCAFILETPYDDPRADVKNLERLRSFIV